MIPLVIGRFESSLLNGGTQMGQIFFCQHALKLSISNHYVSISINEYFSQ
jgi:hypothetical protein